MSKNSAPTTNIEVTPKGLNKLLHVIADTNKGLPLHRQLVLYVASAPGIGKSSLIGAFANETGRHFTDIRLAYAQPTDVRGFPMVEEVDGKKVMTFAFPAEYPRTPDGVLLLDEFSCAPRATQLAALQLLLDKKVGEYTVPDNTVLVLAGNRAIDRANVERLSSAIVNRVVQVTLRADLDEWNSWAIDSQLDPKLIAFMRFRPDLLSDFNASTWDGDSAFASPRSWEAASNLIKSKSFETVTKDLRSALIYGTVGQAAGAQFTAFLDLFGKLPDIDAMIKSPKSGEIPSEPDVKLAMIAAIAPKITKENIGNVLILTDRFPKEFQVLGLKMAMKRDASLLSTKEGTTWLQANSKDLI